MHSLIIGQSESGKSTLAKLMVKQYRKLGKPTAVFDPMYDPDWQCDFSTANSEEFDEYLHTQRGCYFFVDESGTMFDEGNDYTHGWLATRSRHYGHSGHFLAQRAIQLPKTVRDQCRKLFLFTSSAADGKLHAEEWNQVELMKCNKLPQLHFYMCSRFQFGGMWRITPDYRNIQRVSNVTAPHRKA